MQDPRLLHLGLSRLRISDVRAIGSEDLHDSVEGKKEWTHGKCPLEEESATIILHHASCICPLPIGPELYFRFQ